MDGLEVVEKMLADHDEAMASLRRGAGRLEVIGRRVAEAVARGALVMACGNGGSASQADHFVGELTGRFRDDRRPLPAIAFNASQSGMTAIANDYGYDEVFARQVDAFGKPGDVLVVLSTSGNSPNVLRAAERAIKRGVTAIALTGRDGGQLAGLCDLSLNIEAESTARIQEMHILAIHIVCEMIDRELASKQG